MTHLEILKGARELISDPEHWTKEAYAKNSRDEVCPVLDYASACKFCLEGAIWKVTNNWLTALPVLNFLQDNFIPESVIRFNDTSSHTEVIAFLDTVITFLEKGSFDNGSK